MRYLTSKFDWFCIRVWGWLWLRCALLQIWLEKKKARFTGKDKEVTK